MTYRMLLIGGGSGGHVYPLIAVGHALREIALERARPVEIVLMGEGRFFEEGARESGFRFYQVAAGKIRRYFSLLTLWDLVKMPLAFLQSLWHVFWIMPDAVFTKSGYATFFPTLAARIFFIPIYLHDSDAVPGISSRIIGRWAQKVFLSFDKARPYFTEEKTEVTGNPVRQDIFDTARDEALMFFRFSPDLPTVVIFGGSQGAKVISELVLQAIVLLTNQFQVIHQCGYHHYQAINEMLEQIVKEGGEKYAAQINNRYRLFPFFNDRELSLAYQMADVIVSRAGSGALAEIAALGKPGIVIPIRNSANNHQYYNALEFVRYGGILIEEDNLVTSVLIAQIEQAYRRRGEISSLIRQFAHPEAARTIAEKILAGF